MRERTLTVGELNAYIKGVFEDELVLHNLGVRGEIFEYKQTPSATFITLREQDSLLHCVGFEKTQPLKAGDSVVLFGSVTFYERSGKTSFVFRSAQVAGVGDLLAQLQERKERLCAEGLFDHKSPLSSLVRRVAVITGESGVVVHDFLTTLHRKRAFTDVSLYAVTVQGKGAAEEVISALRQADAGGYDAIAVLRGGGSSNDLATFNDESVVRAVAACRTPVVSAVGHETDVTLCDFAASVRAGTPSMAGELLARRNEAFFARWESAVESMEENMRRALARKTSALYRTAAALSYKSELRLKRADSYLERAADRLYAGVLRAAAARSARARTAADKMTAAAQSVLSERKLRLQAATAQLDANDPLRILSRGYAKLYTKDGQTAGTDNTKVGDEIRAVTADGSLSARVTEIRKGERRGK